MKKTFTFLLLTLVLLTAQSQSRMPIGYQVFQKRVVVGGAYNIQNPDFYRTTVNLKGIPVAIEGTIDDVVNSGENIINNATNWIGGVFGNNSNNTPNTEVTQNEDGSVTYKDENGQVFTQRLVDRHRAIVRAQYEVALVPWRHIAEINLRVGNGKYKYLSISAEAEALLFPGTIVNEVKRLISGLSYDRNAPLNTIFVSTSWGWDNSYPGWVIVSKKHYKGIGAGISVPLIKNKCYLTSGISFQVTKPEYKDKKQSFLYLNFKVPLSKK